MHIIFYLHFGCDPRNLKQLKDPRRELEVSQNFHIWIYFKFEKRINLILIFFSPIISNNKNKWEKIIWLLQPKRNIGERILKSNYDFIGILFAILFELEKYCIFENCILVQKNVHLVLNIRFGRWKLFLEFLEFFIYLFRIFPSGQILFKKNLLRPTGRKAQPSRPATAPGWSPAPSRAPPCAARTPRGVRAGLLPGRPLAQARAAPPP